MYKCRSYGSWRFARCLMLIDIHLMFREDLLNRFQVIEQTCFFFMMDKVPRKIIQKVKM